MFFLGLHILYNIIFPESSISFSETLWLVTVTVTMSSDVTDVWQCNHDITLTLTLNPNKEKEKEKKKLNKKTSVQALYVWHNVLLLSSDISGTYKRTTVKKKSISILKKQKIICTHLLLYTRQFFLVCIHLSWRLLPSIFTIASL